MGRDRTETHLPTPFTLIFHAGASNGNPPRTEHGVQNKAEKNKQASVNRKYSEQARGVQKTGIVRAAGTEALRENN